MPASPGWCVTSGIACATKPLNLPIGPTALRAASFRAPLILYRLILAALNTVAQFLLLDQLGPLDLDFEMPFMYPSRIRCMMCIKTSLFNSTPILKSFWA